jgi:hypothetical protein
MIHPNLQQSATMEGCFVQHFPIEHLKTLPQVLQLIQRQATFNRLLKDFSLQGSAHVKNGSMAGNDYYVVHLKRYYDVLEGH